MNTDKAKALLMRLNPQYGFDFNASNEPNRFYIEVVQTLLNEGYKHGPAFVSATTLAERQAVVRRVMIHAFDTTGRAWGFSTNAGFHESVISELLRNPPASVPVTGGFTQADVDAAEKRGYERCKADVARLRA